jgi:hypothetical protein
MKRDYVNRNRWWCYTENAGMIVAAGADVLAGNTVFSLLIQKQLLHN